MSSPASALDILDRLIGFPTVSHGSNLALVSYVEALLASHGIACERITDASGQKASLFASVGPAGPGGLVLSGHSDVVPTEGQAWSRPPFALTEAGGLLFGRGTADMKGFVACALAALVAARNKRLARPLHLALSYDEEIGCVGVRPMLSHLAARGLKPDWVLVGEPTMLHVVTGHKGKTALKAQATGRAGHSAQAPEGLNAIHLAADLIGRLRVLQTWLATSGARDPAYDIPYSTVHVGRIEGGVALNIVPEHCLIAFEIRNIPADDPLALLNAIRADCAAAIAPLRPRFPEADLSITISNAYPGLETPVTAAPVRLLQALTGHGEPAKVAFGTEAGLFQQTFDVPVVVCGPGSMVQGHTADEFIARSEIEACSALLDQLSDGLTV